MDRMEARISGSRVPRSRSFELVVYAVSTPISCRISRPMMKPAVWISSGSRIVGVHEGTRAHTAGVVETKVRPAMRFVREGGKSGTSR
jgi:hypothetical protein